MKQPLMCGHRGAMAYVDQNTLGAFRLTAELGASWVEFDVRRLGDGTLVVHHDPDRDGLLLSEMSWPELHTRFPFIPTLAETLCLLDELGLGAYVELKETGCAADLFCLLEDWDRSRYLVASFIDEAVAEYRQLDPEAELGLICGGIREGAVRREDWRAWERAGAVGARTVIGEAGLVQSGLLDDRPVGGRLWVWDVVCPHQMRLLMERQIDCVVTDWPDLHRYESAPQRLVPLHNADQLQLSRELIRDQLRAVVGLGQPSLSSSGAHACLGRN